MKDLDLCGIGNGIVDILLKIDERDFSGLGLQRGSMELVATSEQRGLLKRFGHSHPVLVSGGSVANSIIAFGQLGGKAGFITCLGDDTYGLHYKGEFEQLGIELGNGSPLYVGEMTGTSVILITPDAERTMRTSLGISAELSDKHVDEELIKRSRWIFVEGYLFSTPEFGQKAVFKAIELAKHHGCKVALTFSSEFIVSGFLPQLTQAVQAADLVFANEEEALVFTGSSSVEEAFKNLRRTVGHVVVTAGPKGAYIFEGGEQHKVEAYKCQPKDLTGAGDMFAGAYLYGLCKGLGARESAQAACYLAMKVITQVGARLQGSVEEFWSEGLRNTSV